MLYPLDQRLDGLARSQGLTYTRYVDDIALSGGSRVGSGRLEPLIKKIINEEGWRLNDKGGPAGPNKAHALLGMVVNAKPNVTSTHFNDVRSLLRLIARGRVRPSRAHLERLEAQVRWIVNVNPERAESLRTPLEEALGAVERKEECPPVAPAMC